MADLRIVTEIGTVQSEGLSLQTAQAGSQQLQHLWPPTNLLEKAQLATTWTLTSIEPGGEVFILLVSFLAAVAGGKLVERAKLHPLLGMMVAGFVLRSVPGVDAGRTLQGEVFEPVRLVALTLILGRAGLGLDMQMLWKLRALLVTVALLPPLSEALVIAGLGHRWLGLPPAWGGMAGTLIAASAPAVVVPALLSLQDRGYGVASGVPSLVLAVAAVCDVLAIAFYSIFYSITFGKGDVVLHVIQAPVELVVGALLGVVLGTALTRLLPQMAAAVEGALQAAGKREAERRERWQVLLCTAATLSAGSCLVVASHHLGCGGLGATGMLVTGCTAARAWGRKRTTAVQAMLGGLWVQGVQPMLFVSIGASLDPEFFKGTLLPKIVVLLLVGVALRALMTVAFASRSDLRMRESLFLAFAWIPKATVQAALGPMPLFKAMQRGKPEEIEWGKHILALSAMSIILTAPPGATLISLTGPKLLTNDHQSPLVALGPIPPEVSRSTSISRPGSSQGHTFAISSRVQNTENSGEK